MRGCGVGWVGDRRWGWGLRHGAVSSKSARVALLAPGTQAATSTSERSATDTSTDTNGLNHQGLCAPTHTCSHTRAHTLCAQAYRNAIAKAVQAGWPGKTPIAAFRRRVALELSAMRNGPLGDHSCLSVRRGGLGGGWWGWG